MNLSANEYTLALNILNKPLMTQLIAPDAEQSIFKDRFRDFTIADT